MSQPTLLVGGGGHALVVGEAILACPDRFTLIGFVDPDPAPATAERLGVPHLGDDTAAMDHPKAVLVLGVGAVGGVGTRPAIVQRFGAQRRWPTVVHPSAYVSPSARLRQGVVVLPSAVVHAGAHVHDFAVINTRAVVEHDVTVGQHSVLAPGAVIGGGSALGDRVSVGLGALVRDNIRVGSDATIAMGATVVADVAPGVLTFGAHRGPDTERRQAACEEA